MASIFDDPRFLPYLQATPMSGRIADPVSLFTRWVPPVDEEEPEEEEEVAEAPVAPVAPVYYPRPQPVDGGDGYDMPVQQTTGSGNFFTDLKGLVSPITDLFTTAREVTYIDPSTGSKTATAPVAYDPSQDLGPFATLAPALQSAPISPVEVSDFPAPVGSQPNPILIDPVAAAELQQEIAREAPLNNFTTAELNQFNSPFSPDLPGAMTMDMASNQTPVDAAVTASQTGQQQAVDPALVGETDPITGVTAYEDGFRSAPAPDPYEESFLSGVKGVFGYPGGQTYADGRFNALGEDTWREGYAEDDKMRGLASKVGSFVGPSILGPIFGGMIAGTRIGAEEGPYGRDGAGNFRFNAAGPMGTIQSPYGVLNTGPAYGHVATNDYSGLYGLGTLYNTGKSRTPMMFDPDGTFKSGGHGYGWGWKADGTWGSPDAFDVLDPAGMYENARDFSYGDGADAGGLDSGYDYDAGTEDWGGPDDDGGWDYF